MERLGPQFSNGQRIVGDLLPVAGHRPGNWREWTVIDVAKNCPHTTCSVFEVENEHGIWGVEICTNCGTLVQRECPHVSNSWNEEGTVLTCDNCGIDGT